MYTIINDKKYNIIECNTFKSKSIGLMFKKQKIKDIYMFYNCSSIHTFFMYQNIDICILDKNMNVLYLKENMKKNKILVKKGYYTLEMPLGSAKYLKINQVLEIKKNA